MRTSRADGSRSRRAGAGYTLIELTVVVLIIMTVAAVGLPPLLSWVDEGNLGAASRRLAGMVRYVRHEAARRQQRFFLTIDLENHAYWIETLRDLRTFDPMTYSASWSDPEDQRYEPYEDEFVGRQELRKRIVFDRVVYQNADFERSGKVRIEFRPDGTTESVSIYLRNTSQMEATIRLDGDTGRVEVYDYRVEPERQLELYEQYESQD